MSEPPRTLLICHDQLRGRAVRYYFSLDGPNGGRLVWQPYGEAGLLIADLNLSQVTGLLASRFGPRLA